MSKEQIFEIKCGQCGLTKTVDQYYPSSTSETGYNRYCKSCCKVNRSLEAIRKRDKKSKISVRQLHRAKTLGVEYDEDITLAGIYKKALGICHLCGGWVTPKQASPDHIIPLSKGGTHTHDNVALSHLKCNLRKGNRHK